MADTFKDMLVAAAGPDGNVVIGGNLVQGEVTPMMAAMLEARQKMRALPDNASEEDVQAILQPVSAMQEARNATSK